MKWRRVIMRLRRFWRVISRWATFNGLPAGLLGLPPKFDFLLLDLDHALARGVVARFEDETENGGDFAEVFLGDGKFERALLEQMDRSRSENVLAESGLIDDGGDGRGVGIRIRRQIEREALEIAAELPDADIETEAVRRRKGDLGCDLFLGHAVIPEAELVFLVRCERGEGSDGSGFTHNGLVVRGQW
jgi:hypothetical protein